MTWSLDSDLSEIERDMIGITFYKNHCDCLWRIEQFGIAGFRLGRKFLK